MYNCCWMIWHVRNIIKYSFIVLMHMCCSTLWWGKLFRSFQNYALVSGVPEAYGSRFVYVYMCVCICINICNSCFSETVTNYRHWWVQCRHNATIISVSDFWFKALFSGYLSLCSPCERSKVKQKPNSSQWVAFQLDSWIYATGQAATWVKIWKRDCRRLSACTPFSNTEAWQHSPNLDISIVL